MPKAMMLIFSQPTSPDVEEEYFRWYTTKHLPDVAGVTGVVSATLYKLDKSVQAMPGLEGDPRSYLAIYEIEGETSEDLTRFSQALGAAIKEGKVDVSPALDFSTVSSNFVLPVSERITAG